MATQYYSNSDIITWAKGSQAMARLRERKKLAMQGLSPSEDLDMKLYCARKSLEWQVAQNPSDSLVYELADYVYALCFPYVLEVMQIVSDGGAVIEPTTPTGLTGSTLNFIELRKRDFSNATDYVDDRLNGKDLSVIGSWLGSRLINEGTEWEFINGNTFRILIDGFDSSAFDSDTIIARIDINGEISASQSDSITYDLTEVTEIASLATASTTLVRNVIVKPNGFDYTWANTFVFTDNNPEQPSATRDGTTQVYTFMYIAGLGDLCVNQSITL